MYRIYALDMLLAKADFAHRSIIPPSLANVNIKLWDSTVMRRLEGRSECGLCSAAPDPGILGTCPLLRRQLA